MPPNKKLCGLLLCASTPAPSVPSSPPKKKLCGLLLCASTPAPSVPSSPPKEDKENWVDVVHTKATGHIASGYFTGDVELSKLEPDVSVENISELIHKKVELKPGTAYKFRVAAVNACGRGPWQEVTAFTLSESIPGAPRSVKICSTGDGAKVTWEPPVNPGNILEYSVFLAVKPNGNAAEPKPGVSDMSFVRVYCGPVTQCTVPSGALGQALVDTSSIPSLILRIAAKNDKGYGPSVQVRWLWNNI